MKVDVFPMENFADAPGGADILRHAFLKGATNITQRLAPETTHEDGNGGYLIMLLDWKNSSIVRVILNEIELGDLVEVMKSLHGMTVLDSFQTKGMTVQ